MLKKLVALSLLVTTVCVTPACGAAWWQNFKNNPVAQVQTFEEGARITLGIADVAWNSLKVYLPAAELVTAQADYNKAVLAVNTALGALDDGVQAALEAQTPNPDFSKLIGDVTDAVTKVVAIVNDLKTKVPASATVGSASVAPPEPLGFPELQVSLKLVQRSRVNATAK
jgi:hypothetical protein